MVLVDWVLALAFYILKDADATLPQAHQEGMLRPYRSYADVTLFHYYIPPEANVATFEFAAFMDSAKCPVREAYIYIQHGSYPVMPVDNGTFPNNFWINRTALQKIVVKSSYNTHDASIVPIYNPLPGNWFAAAYLNTWNQKVQQEGLGHVCQYSLGSVGLWSLVPDVNTIPLKSSMNFTSSKHFTYYKFYVPSGVMLFTLKITNCRFLTGRWYPPESVGSGNVTTESPCIHNVFIRDRGLPFYKSNQTDSIVTIGKNSSYSHTQKLPYTDVYYYLLIVSESKVDYKITILVEECPIITFNKNLLQQFSGIMGTSTKDQVLQVNLSIHSNASNPDSASHINEILHDSYEKGFGAKSTCPCPPSFRLTRIRHAQDFSDTFLLEGKDWYTTWLALTDRNQFGPVIGTSFELLPFIDIGGTLSVGVHLDELLLNVTAEFVHVDICMKQGKRPDTYCCNHDIGNATGCCSSGIHLHVSSKNVSEINDIIYIPFPEADVYYISFQMYCERDGSIEKCIMPEALISLDIRTQPCVLGKRLPSKSEPVSPCGSYGYCQEVHKSQYFYTACTCIGGYKGWACTDDSQATPKSILLMTTLLLTISNIFFIPAIVLALIYSCTMISSTLYHACDQELYGYCLTRYQVLQFCDFFCSILAFWVTIIAIARSPPEFESVLYIFGSVLIAIGVEYNRRGLLVFVIPFGIGAVYVVSIWIYRSLRRGSVVVPKVGRLLLFIPGVLLGASGLILFAFVETEENYRYTHSAWHTIIAISLLYLLPKQRKVEMKIVSPSSSSVAEMAHVNTDYQQQQISASPVFFVTSELDHLVQERPQ